MPPSGAGTTANSALPSHATVSTFPALARRRSETACSGESPAKGMSAIKCPIWAALVRFDRVVPPAVEVCRVDIDLGDLLVCHRDALGIAACIEFAAQRSIPIPTECSSSSFEFARVESRAVVAAFDGGRIKTDANTLLLGAADRMIGLSRFIAGCFADASNPALIEHEVETLVPQRVVGIAIGYEDLIDHDQLRHDPIMATLAGKLAVRRWPASPR